MERNVPITAEGNLPHKQPPKKEIQSLKQFHHDAALDVDTLTNATGEVTSLGIPGLLPNLAQSYNVNLEAETAEDQSHQHHGYDEKQSYKQSATQGKSKYQSHNLEDQLGSVTLNSYNEQEHRQNIYSQGSNLREASPTRAMSKNSPTEFHCNVPLPHAGEEDSDKVVKQLLSFEGGLALLLDRAKRNLQSAKVCHCVACYITIHKHHLTVDNLQILT
jgi:hypothetical protein